MDTFGVDDDTAFQMLRAYSSIHNIKVFLLGQRVVAGLSDPTFSRADPVRSLLDILLSFEADRQRDSRTRGRGSAQLPLVTTAWP